MAQSTRSYRPETDAERDSILRFDGSIDDVASLHRVVVAQLEADFRPCAARFSTARLANQAAATRATLSSARVHAVDAAFVDAFGRWTRSVDYVRDEKVVAAALRARLGDRTPSDFVKESPRLEVSRMVEVLEHVRLTPGLTGDPERLAVLRTVTAELGVALADHDAAVAARGIAVEELGTAELEFDAAWGLLVATLLRHDRAGLGALVPTFARARRGRRGTPAAERAVGSSDGDNVGSGEVEAVDEQDVPATAAEGDDGTEPDVRPVEDAAVGADLGPSEAEIGPVPPIAGGGRGSSVNPGFAAWPSGR